MKKVLFLLIALQYAACASGSEKEPSIAELTEKVMDIAVRQYTAMALEVGDSLLPRTVNRKGELVTSDIYWWCSGFYPGSLWYLYEYTGSTELLELARKYTELLAPLQYLTTDHDIGFQLFCSYGNGYRLTGDRDYLEVLHNGARSLATRFNPVVGSLCSWDWAPEIWSFPVIIDNMMNLELIMWVGEKFQDPELAEIAVIHANTCMRNHFREDNSTFHLVDYDPVTGEVLGRQTFQGYSDDSKWARGQAWGLYGFTMMYRMSPMPEYLRQAERIADLLIPLLPPDGIPYWDFDSPDIPDDLRDASAAAIMASALTELSSYIPEKKDLYLATAKRQVYTLASDAYMARPGENANFILRHSVGNKPGEGEVDVPLTYADYYFIEALSRLNNLAE